MLAKLRILHFARDDKIANSWTFVDPLAHDTPKIRFLSFARSLWLFHNGAKLKKETHPARFIMWFCTMPSSASLRSFVIHISACLGIRFKMVGFALLTAIEC